MKIGMVGVDEIFNDVLGTEIESGVYWILRKCKRVIKDNKKQKE